MLKFLEVNAVHSPNDVSGIVRMTEQIDIGEFHFVDSCRFRCHATRHHDLVGRPFDGIVMTYRILRYHLHDFGSTTHGPVGDIYPHPRTCSAHKHLSFRAFQCKVPKIERAVRSLVPCGEFHGLTPFRMSHEVEVHP